SLLDGTGVMAALAALAAVERAPEPVNPRPETPGGIPESFAEEEGGLPLLPSAHRLRAAAVPVERLQESVLLDVPAGLASVPLRRAVARLARRHAALRLRLHRVDGIWSQEILPSALAPAVVDPDTLRRVDATGLGPAALARVIAAEARSTALALSPGTGAVLRAVWFDAGPDVPGRLLLTAHLLTVDDASWELLIPELAALCTALSDGREPPYPASAGGLRSWAAGLLGQAQSRERAAELPYWRSLLGTPGTPPAAWGERPGPELETTIPLPADADQARLDATVLAALALAAEREPRLRGDATGPGLLVEAELPSPLRPPHLVGRLTTVRPVRLDPAGPRGGSDRESLDRESPGPESLDREPLRRESLRRKRTGRELPDRESLDPELLDRVASALAAVPDGGRGHEELRHLNPQTAPALADAPHAVVRYTRHRAESASPGPPGWRRAPAEARAALRSALALVAGTEPPLSGPLEVTARTRPGVLVLRWRWAGGLFTDEEARTLTTRTTEMITTAVNPHGISTSTSTSTSTTEEETAS
ncbi:condensation domain-containing protein, partial [Streptomyces sp. NPDC055078]